ncbi:hypothetical protein [Saccharospirillum sp. MSK14-1]|uniref:hypothetical protein n=1 Tax=Saccharospirillum sp. MSK14-1 TaxID=1897632 RepID=UPI0011B29841|nr:hypothetical protein [Saccharospirillum sp. MSK14-1]
MAICPIYPKGLSNTFRIKPNISIFMRLAEQNFQRHGQSHYQNQHIASDQHNGRQYGRKSGDNNAQAQIDEHKWQRADKKAQQDQSPSKRPAELKAGFNFVFSFRGLC